MMTSITPNKFQDTLEQAETYHQQACQLLDQHDIHPTPTNYTVAYEYATERHRELNAEISRQLARGGSLDNFFFLGLFERYFLQENAENLDNQVSDIHQILDQALDGISTASDDFSSYEKTLESKIVELRQQPEPQDFKIIAANLMLATQRTLENSNRLSQHLEQSNQEIQKLQTELEEIRQEAYTDALTGLYNRKALTSKLEQLLAQAQGSNLPVSILMLDIDHFKRFNDSFGHLIGDEVIRRVAASLKKHAVSDIIAARYGGEEFTVVMPNTRLERAVELGMSINAAVAKLVLMRRKTQERLPGITISVGAASMQPGDHQDDLLERADRCLYQAKCNGRNQVISEAQLAAIDTAAGLS
jgi:diguanylate cyclase